MFKPSGYVLAALLLSTALSSAGEYDYLIAKPTRGFDPPPMPDSVLCAIPTKDLAALIILNMPMIPMRINISSVQPVKREPVMLWLDSYNGGRELSGREDVASALLAYYKNIRVEPPLDRTWPAESLEFVNVWTLGSVEIIASDRRVLDKASQDELREFLETALAKYNERLLYPDYYSNVGMYCCLLIGECLRRLGSPDYYAWISDEDNWKAMQGLPLLGWQRWEPIVEMGRRFLASVEPGLLEEESPSGGMKEP